MSDEITREEAYEILEGRAPHGQHREHARSSVRPARRHVDTTTSGPSQVSILRWLLAEARWIAEGYAGSYETTGEDADDVRGELPWWPECPSKPAGAESPGHDLRNGWNEPSVCRDCGQEFPL